MLTLLSYYSVKPERIEDFQELARRIVSVPQGTYDGCVSMAVHQQSDNPREFLVYEQWRDQAALEAFIAQLNRMFADQGGIDPVIDALIDQTHAVAYDVVA